MISLFKALLIIHITGGTAGLISGTIAASVTKGGKIHRISGLVFFWSMLIAAFDALVLSNLPNHHNIFLFAVGGFTLYMVSTGYRLVHVKRAARTQDHPFTMLDYAILVFGIGFGLFLVYMGIRSLVSDTAFGIVPCVFGLICLSIARNDIAMFSGKQNVRKTWMRNHIIRMMGAMIASYTAFLVVNIKFQPNWVLWLAPTAVGGVFISYFIRKYTRPKKDTTPPNP